MYYYVCERCEAKYFSRRRVEPCPRCRRLLTSRETLTPPWQTYRRPVADLSASSTPTPGEARREQEEEMQ